MKRILQVQQRKIKTIVTPFGIMYACYVTAYFRPNFQCQPHKNSCKQTSSKEIWDVVQYSTLKMRLPVYHRLQSSLYFFWKLTLWDCSHYQEAIQQSLLQHWQNCLIAQSQGSLELLKYGTVDIITCFPLAEAEWSFYSNMIVWFSSTPLVWQTHMNPYCLAGGCRGALSNYFFLTKPDKCS